jgi:hypothetical protein
LHKDIEAMNSTLAELKADRARFAGQLAEARAKIDEFEAAPPPVSAAIVDPEAILRESKLKQDVVNL